MYDHDLCSILFSKPGIYTQSRITCKKELKQVHGDPHDEGIMKPITYEKELTLHNELRDDVVGFLPVLPVRIQDNCCRITVRTIFAAWHPEVKKPDNAPAHVITS